MNEADFWVHLEFRLSAELEGMDDRTLRHWWCDGFNTLHLDTERGCFIGTCWMVDGQKQQMWDFALYLGDEPCDRERINWAALLPDDELTGWVDLDFKRKIVTLRPANAYRA